MLLENVIEKLFQKKKKKENALPSLILARRPKPPLSSPHPAGPLRSLPLSLFPPPRPWPTPKAAAGPHSPFPTLLFPLKPRPAQLAVDPTPFSAQPCAPSFPSP